MKKHTFRHNSYILFTFIIQKIQHILEHSRVLASFKIQWNYFCLRTIRNFLLFNRDWFCFTISTLATKSTFIGVCLIQHHVRELKDSDRTEYLHNHHNLLHGHLVLCFCWQDVSSPFPTGSFIIGQFGNDYYHSTFHLSHHSSLFFLPHPILFQTVPSVSW